MLCHVSVHSGAFCLRHRARDPISVAFFDRVALFSDFNQLFELQDQVFLPIAVLPFIYSKYDQRFTTFALAVVLMNTSENFKTAFGTLAQILFGPPVLNGLHFYF